MSTIIECPACLTRYKMNKAIPEGGRHVKCARCGNQWRLVPEGHIDENIEAEGAEHNPVGYAQEGAGDASPAQSEERYAFNHEQQHSFQAGESSHYYQEQDQPAPDQPGQHSYGQEEAEHPHQEEDSYGTADTGSTRSWQARRDAFSAAIPSLSDMTAAIETPSASPDSMGADRQEEQDSADEADGDYSNWGRQSFAQRFDTASGFSEESQDPDAHEAAAAADPEPGADWMEMNRTWREIAEAGQPRADDNDEDAEAAIREALKEALEQPDASAGGEPYAPEAKASPSEPPRSRFGWPSFGRSSREDAGRAAAEEYEDEEPLAEASEADQEHRPFTIPGHHPVEDDVYEDEAPFRLTGVSANRPVYGKTGLDEDEAEEDADADPRDPGLQHDIAGAFRAAPLQNRPFEPVGKLPGAEAPSDFDRLYDEHAEDTAGEFNSQFYENEAADLQDQLERTDIAAYENRHGVGGLAVAAGWAIFISIISGIALVLVSFRQDIMAALPGTTSLYSAIGFKVPDQGVDFADVSYRWTEAEGKPMIEVRGQVVNVTDRVVQVPRVLINVRDGQSADTVKATATVQTETLEPRQRADFTLEFVSPPKNVSQIELEFDANR